MTKTKTPTPLQSSILPEAGVIITALAPNAGAEPIVAKLDKNLQGSSKWVEWGLDNDWPRQIRLKVEKNTTAYPMIFKAVQIIFGNGVNYFRKEIVDGKIKLNFDRIPEIEKFFLDNKINRFFLEQLMDYKFSGNTFQEYILTNDRSKICNLYHKEAEFSRISVQDETTRLFEKLGYSGEWHEQPSEVDELLLIDPRKTSKDDILETIGNEPKFAHHVYFPSPGRQTYALPPHAALYREKGWLDYSNSVPEIMNTMIECQAIIKYHIKIPYTYWTSLYPKWDDYAEVKRQEKIDEKIEEMNKFLTGTENAYKSFISHYMTDPITKKELPGWEIIPIDDKTKKDDWIPGTNEADTQITRAIGVDISMSGIQPAGGKLGAGSGSDKRVGMTNSIALSKAEQEIIFEPLEIIKTFNGWPDDVQFGFEHIAPTKLDENPTGSETIL